MLKSGQKRAIWRIFSFLKPIAGALLILMILRVTGLLAHVSTFTNAAMMQTGVLDAEPEAITAEEQFDFDFTVRTLDGQVKAVSELKGKVIFLNLWATWCGPCRAEMPGIEELYQQVDKSQIEFVMLSVDRPGLETKVKNFVQAQEYTFPVYTLNSELPEVLQVPSIPTTFVIDKSGKIVQKKVGTTQFNTPRFREYLRKLVTQ
jgi:thiol-disulfide isomerase/thioredoxin